jgi:serine/threonine-protein kinase
MAEKTSSARPAAAAGSVLAGRYRLDEKLGEDATSEVHRATDQKDGRTVVAKIIHVDGASRRERTVREIKRASQVRHPGLVEVLDVGRTDEGAPFVITEHVEGERLSDRLSRGGKIAPAEAAAIATKICAALAAAHDAGVVHRDVRPSRVTLTGDAPDVKVHGLGLPHGGASGAGDDAFAAPEHRRGEPVGRRADVYSIGAMLHAMLTGSAPGEGAAVEGPLASVVARCIAEDPRERFVDTGELEDALLAALAPAEGAPASRPPAARSHPPKLKSEPPSTRIPTVPPAAAASRPPQAGASKSSRPPPKSEAPAATASPGRAPAAPPPRPLGRPLVERPKWEEKLLDVRDGPAPRVAAAVVLVFALVRIVRSGVVPWIAAVVAGLAAYLVWHLRRRATHQD